MWELSDFEEVKLTQGQFQDWLKQSVAQMNALNRIAEAIIGLKEARLEQKINHLIDLLEAGVNIPDLGFINAKLDLIQGLIENEGPITNLSRKVDEFMATQEERLQAISTKIDEVLSDLATLKVNNPQIEDEISAIESKLSIAQPTPTEPPV